MSFCLSDSDFSALAAGKLDPKSEAGVREHLSSCDKCSGSFERFRNQVPQTIDSPPSRPLMIDGLFPPAAPPKSDRDDASRHYPKIDGYRILGVLGQGGMGIVYRAVQTKLNRTVALKVLPAMMGAANPSAVSRFRREATAAARLHHTNIIPIHDFGESRDAYYYAMDLIIGQPLNVLIRRMSAANAPVLSPTRLSEVLRAGDAEVIPTALDETGRGETFDDSGSSFSSTPSGRGRAYFQHVARWMADAADALHYAHGQGIIHRDIKPGNLILSVDGRIMVADFGLAKTVDEESVTMTGALLGSLRYVSPEQAMAKRVRVDHRTDIYSLGATMYELLCFQPAFPGTDEKEILGAIIARDPTATRKILPAVPSELETICLKTLEKSPDARYPTARALAEDLRRYINDLPIQAKRPGPIKRVVKFVRRRKAPVIAVTAIVLLIGAGFVVRHQQRKTRDAQFDNLNVNARRMIEEKQWDDAEAALKSALELAPENPKSLLYMAWLKLEYHKAFPDQAGARALEDAEAASRRVLEKDPANITALGYRGVALRRLKRYPEAIETFERALAVDNESYAQWSNLGAVHLMMREMKKAEQCLRRGAEVAGQAADNPAYRAAAWRSLAVYELFRKNAEVVQSIEKAKNFDTKNALAWTTLARVQLELEGYLNVPDALDNAKHADKLANHGDPRAKRIRALAHLRKNEFNDAVVEAGKAITLKDAPTPNHLVIAIAEARRGQVKAANDALTAADAAWPSELREPGGFVASAEAGDLWIESADDLMRLKTEADAVIAAASGSKP